MRRLSANVAVALMLSTAAIPPAPASPIQMRAAPAATDARAGADLADSNELRGRSWIAIALLVGLAALAIYFITDDGKDGGMLPISP